MSSNVDQELKLAKKYLAEGDTGAAEVVFRRVLAQFPKNHAAQTGLKTLLSHQQKDKIRTVAPPQSAVQAVIGLYHAGRLQEAVVHGEELARQYPHYFEIYNILAAANLSLGKAEASLKYYNKALQIKPDFPDAYNNMGILLYEQGKLDQAIANYQKAILIEPDFADAYFNLGNAFKQKGDLIKAVQNYQKSLLIQPDDAEVLLNYGHALSGDGQFEKAIEAYQRALQLQPELVDAQISLAKALMRKIHVGNSEGESLDGAGPEINVAEYHNSMGVELADKGAVDAAISSYKQALKIMPDYAEAYNNLGLVLMKKGQIATAKKNFERAVEIKQDFAAGHFNLGNCLLRKDNFERAIASYQAALTIDETYAEAHNNLGNAYSKSKQPDLAIKSYKAALRLKPNYTDAYLNLGSLQLEYGHFDAAIGSYQQALRVDPTHAIAHSFLAYIQKYDGSEPHIRQMKALYQDTETSDDDRIHLGFALGKVLEDASDFEMSFQFLRQGNHLRKKQLRYDLSHDRRLFSQIKTMFENRSADQIKRPTGSSQKQPIFIVGMPRSGTSLIEQIISSHSMVYGAGELETLARLIGQFNPFQWYFSADDLSKLGQAYLRSLRGFETNKPLISDKMPLNFRWIGFILSVLPEAKIIHVQRDAKATCWSIFKQYFWDAGNGYAYDMKDLCEYYKMYRDLMGFWHSKYPGKIYDLNYERLTEDQETETRKLISYLNLNWEDKCLDFHKNKRSVKTASNVQVREKMYTGSSQKWRHYEPYLAEMLRGLERC